MAKSPAVILFDSNGVAMAVAGGVAIPAGTKALLAAGSDGTAARLLLVDANGRPIVVGAGTAGAPAGGVVSIQGVAGGVALPVTGSVSVANPSIGPNSSPAPASSTQIGGSDGANLQAARVFDADTGGATQYVLGVGLRKAASGGSVEAGTASDPLRVDPTGTTTQPISAVSLPLPAGAATEATLATRLAEATFTARINTQGQKAMAASTPVVLASDQTAVSIADGGGSITVDTPQLPASLVGSRLDVNNGAWLGSTAPTVGQKAMAASLPVVVSSDQTAIPITAASLPLPAGAATEATLATRLADATFTARINTLGPKTSTASTPVVLASDQSPLPVTDNGSSLTVDSDQLPPALVNGRLNTNLGSWFGSTTPTIGQKTMTGSLPVAISSDQSSIPVTDNGGSLTVDGSVAITSLVSGVGATNLGKAEDTAAASGDTGVAVLGVYQPDTVGVSADTPGDYATLNIDDKGRLRVSPGGLVVIDAFESATGITAVNTDVTNIALSTNHVRGLSAVSFDIVNSAANSAFALIQKTIPAIDLSQLATGITFVQLLMFIPSLVNVGNVVIRLGTDASNYNSWSLSVAEATSVGGVWQTFRAALGSSNASVGAGWNLASVTYYAVGLEMTSANAALAGVVVDSLWAIGGQVHGSDVSSEISTVVSTAKVDLSKINGTNTATDRGASTAGTLRVAVATDDINLAAINANQTSGLQQTKITNGANTAAVKAASTAAVAADPALVVAVSPNNTVAISAASLPLPTGAATEATLGNRLAEATFTARINTLGQKAMAASTPVVLASDQSSIPIADGGGSITVDGAVTANIGTTNGLALDATLTGGTQRTRITDGTSNAAVKAASTAPVAADPALVVALSPNSALLAAPGNPTATLTNVAGSASSVTLIASNTNRKGAMVQNDSTATLYLKFGTGASATSYTVQMASGSYYEVPFSYTGVITGLWGSATGFARCTEVT